MQKGSFERCDNKTAQVDESRKQKHFVSPITNHEIWKRHTKTKVQKLKVTCCKVVTRWALDSPHPDYFYAKSPCFCNLKDNSKKIVKKLKNCEQL